MSRAWIVVGSLVVALVGARAAHAGGRIAVLPFAGDGRMALYGQPVAAEVAKVGRAAGLEVVLLAAGDEVPADARLVVDGRLVRSGAAIVLEARVRDPERGLDVARRSATAPTLAVVDRAADDVAAALVPAIRDGLAAQDEARARAAVLAVDVTRAKPVAPADAAIDRRPLALIALIGPSAGALAGRDGQVQGIAPLVAPSLLRLADRLGYRAAPLGEQGLAAPAATVASADARLAIVIAVLDVDARGGDVPRGRARARVDVYDRGGLVFRRVVRTDTLVGSRGDRADTLVRAAVDQVVDVVTPRVRERLAASGAAP